MHRQIFNRWTNAVIWEGEAETVNDAIHAAFAAHADLRGAVLRDAVLRDAVLRGADLRGAVLTGAVLRGAVLTDAVLRGADLRDADLRDADLRGADLRGADLGGADLRNADLSPIRDDLWAVLSSAPVEVPALLDAIRQGRINGSSYEGDCACLVGTIANARHCYYKDIPTLAPNASRPAEVWFLGINIGDTPATNQYAKLAEQWIIEWLDRMTAAFGKEPVSA